MPNPFEGPSQEDPKQLTEQDQPEEEQSEEDAAHLAEFYRNIFEKLDSIVPSGDPVADGILYDDITNRGRMAERFTSEQAALRSLLAMKQLEEESLADAHPYVREYSEKRIATLSRLLEHYSVTAETTQEFDDQKAHQEGADIRMMHRGLEAFVPTGNIDADALVFIALTKNRAAAENFANGRSAGDVLRDTYQWNEEAIKGGIRPHDSAEARYLIREVFSIQNHLIENILIASDNRG